MGIITIYNLSNSYIIRSDGVEYGHGYTSSGYLNGGFSFNLPIGVNATIYLASGTEYRPMNEGVCVYMTGSYGNFFKIIPILGTILGVLILLGGIGMVIYGIKNPDVVSEKIESIDWDKLTSLNLVTGTILGIGIIAILSVVSIISLHFICAV